MSRNLLADKCVVCGDEVELDEHPRQITKEDAGTYLDEYRGMLVAKAHCPSCEAQYLAWMDDTNSETRRRWPGRPRSNSARPGRPFDLSYQSSFNDEPGEGDGPRWTIQTVVTRIRVTRNI